MSFVTFTCPECKSHRLEEVMVNVTLTSVITRIGEGGDLDYGLQIPEDGEIERYQCVDCGWVIPDCQNSEDLFDALEVVKMVKESHKKNGPWFRNYYECPCGEHWEDEWECCCDDRCPACNTAISPSWSEELSKNETTS
jgi:hypothetical protein